MTAPDSRDSVERVVADMRENFDAAPNEVFPASQVRGWMKRLQPLARGPQQAGGEDWLSEAVAVVYPDTGLRNDEAALAIWRAHMYDTGGEPLFSADMVEALQAEVARLKEELQSALTARDLAQAAAEHRGAALREESARLDWLDTRGEAYGFESTHEGNRWLIEGAYPNLRAAIDAARLVRDGDSGEG